jgi:hypothetical protein
VSCFYYESSNYTRGSQIAKIVLKLRSNGLCANTWGFGNTTTVAMSWSQSPFPTVMTCSCVHGGYLCARMLDGSFLVVHVPILEMESFEPTCSTNGQLILFLKRRTAKKFFKEEDEEEVWTGYEGYLGLLSQYEWKTPGNQSGLVQSFIAHPPTRLQGLLIVNYLKVFY